VLRTVAGRRELKPELVILDVTMPDLDGVERPGASMSPLSARNDSQSSTAGRCGETRIGRRVCDARV
jgi:DNA-binding response OmpR family regulator